MTKEELFEKYHINESHNVWDNGIDNWMSVEVYRIMHDGNLPPEDDQSTAYVCEFLDKVKEHGVFFLELRKRTPDDFGSLFLTSKRMVYTLADEILKELNNG